MQRKWVETTLSIRRILKKFKVSDEAVIKSLIRWWGGKTMQERAAIIKSAEEFVKEELQFDPSGHDWWHAHRVRRLALELARHENADLFVCELTALLHDVADEKLNVSKEAGLNKVERWLVDKRVGRQIIQKIIAIISTMSYSQRRDRPMETIEGRVVQDADRLDALGAIGIGRTFLYAGLKGQLLHDPDGDFETLDYRSINKTAIYYFHERLLQTKDSLNTEYAKKIARNRHQFIETFLQQFYREWDFTDYND